MDEDDTKMARLSELAMPDELREDPLDPAAEVFETLEINPLRPGKHGLGGVLAKDGRDLHLAAEVQQRGGSIYDTRRSRPSTRRLALWWFGPEKRYKELFRNM